MNSSIAGETQIDRIWQTRPSVLNAENQEIRTRALVREIRPKSFFKADTYVQYVKVFLYWQTLQQRNYNDM